MLLKKNLVLLLCATWRAGCSSANNLYAQTLSSKSVTLANQLLTLSSERQDAVIGPDAWAELGVEMDKLNAQAKATQGNMQSAEANVETAKTLLSLVGKLAAVL